MARPYLLRFFPRLLAEVIDFMTSQQMITTFLLALVAAAYQLGAKRLTAEAFKQNIASVIYPFVWVVCGVAAMYVVKAAMHLHRDILNDWRQYKPSIQGFKPKRPSAIPGVLTSSVFLSLLGLLSYWTFIVAFREPTLIFRARAETVARLYMNGKVPPADHDFTLMATASSEELFYDWILEARPTDDVFQVTIVVRSYDPNEDRVNVLSEEASISDRQPHWRSGFREPKPPDYWERTIHFATIPKGKTATVILRSPIKFVRGDEVLTEWSIKREFDAKCSPCKVETAPADPHAQAVLVLTQLGRLSGFFNGPEGKKLPVRIDPDVQREGLPIGDYESTVEARCHGERCEVADLSGASGQYHPASMPVGPRLQIQGIK